MSSIRVELPAPLLRHASITTGHEVHRDVPAPVTLRPVLDTLELSPLHESMLWDYLERAAHAMVNSSND